MTDVGDVTWARTLGSTLSEARAFWATSAAAISPDLSPAVLTARVRFSSMASETYKNSFALLTTFFKKKNTYDLPGEFGEHPCKISFMARTSFLKYWFVPSQSMCKYICRLIKYFVSNHEGSFSFSRAWAILTLLNTSSFLSLSSVKTFVILSIVSVRLPS